MHDPNNPIAQVQKPADTLNNSSASLILNQNQNNNQNHQNNNQNNNNQNNNGKRRLKNNNNGKGGGGLFKSFLCCFMSNNGANHHNNQNNQNNQNNNGSQHQLTNVNSHPGSGANSAELLPTMQAKHHGKKCLVLDLDETLVHSSFKPVANADFVVPVEIEGQVHQVYVVKRPGVDDFLRSIGDLFEIVVFTASLAKYADPVLDLLDKYRVVHYRLFREACHNHKGNYVKDLSRLGRDLKSTIIIDNSPTSYMFHPENAIPVDSWFDDENDRELLELIPLLQDITKVEDVRLVLDKGSRPKWG